MKKIVPALMTASTRKPAHGPTPARLLAFEDELNLVTGGLIVGGSTGGTMCLDPSSTSDIVDDG